MAEAGQLIQLRVAQRFARVRARSLDLNARCAVQPIAVLAGHSLPAGVGEIVQGTARALCLGPTDWLIVSRELDALRLCAQLRTGIPETSCALVDLSDGLATLELTGAPIRTLLAKGCGVDLHPQVLAGGRCVRTRFAELAVVIDCIEDNRFELHVSRSYCAYLFDWLADAATEFGVAT